MHSELVARVDKFGSERNYCVSNALVLPAGGSGRWVGEGS
jgi:hypothetical protein